MRVITLMIFLSLSLHGKCQCINNLDKVKYDIEGNIISVGSLLWLEDSEVVTMKDTITNIRYRLDRTQTFITALDDKGNTLWTISPFVNKNKVELEDTNSGKFRVRKPKYITAIALVKNPDYTNSCNPSQLAILIRSDERTWGNIDLNTKQYFWLGQD